jgi:beta-galactosidase
MAINIMGASAMQAQSSAPHTFAVQGDHFALDGKPYQIIAGSIHYTRIPREYWRDRLRKARAMGLNTITTYAFWNAHEVQPGVYDFSGNNDIAEFIREAQQEGLQVILRTGPYACAEWEFGGYPAWLLKDHDMVVRSDNPEFLQAATRWLHRLGEEVAPLQIGNGGPIIAVQVENEYGSYGEDHAYMEQIHHVLMESGFTKAMLYTADGADVLQQGALPELPAAINFGPGDAQRSFDLLKKFRPSGPFLCGEYWDGWFDHWGAKHETPDAVKQIEELKWMLAQGYSVNLYMFDGGTSFGWMNGANSDGTNYQPDVTSYDYDVAVGEGGDLRPKYFAFRKVIEQATHATLPAPPQTAAPVAFPAVQLQWSASLWENLPAAIHAQTPLTMEDVDQSYGYILYRTTIHKLSHGPVNAKLKFDALHDYARIYLDGKLQGTVDRRLNQAEIDLPASAPGARLDILVENSGRVNYGKFINRERAGIVGQVYYDGKPLTDWSIYPLKMQNLTTLSYSQKLCEGPCFYRAQLTIDKPGDTFLDTRRLSKGTVWINGRVLGRFWKVGPQKTLYLPAPWLNKGINDVTLFDLDGGSQLTIQGLDHPILDELSSQ